MFLPRNGTAGLNQLINIIQIKMVDRVVVYEALKQCLTNDSGNYSPEKSVEGQASLISSLIHDIFGGEILKTHMKRGWHFYNRIEGKRIDFTTPDFTRSADDTYFEDIPTDPDETFGYFGDEEYSNFLMRFVSAFEEVVGLEKYRPELSS
jgi:hypothetical protein